VRSIDALQSLFRKMDPILEQLKSIFDQISDIRRGVDDWATGLGHDIGTNMRPDMPSGDVPSGPGADVALRLPGGDEPVRPGYEPGGRWADRQARQDWVTELKNGPDTGPMDLRTRRTTTSSADWAQYQRRVAGPEEYRLQGGDASPVWADSVRVDTDGVTEVDAKYVPAPGARSSIYEGSSPEFLLHDFDGEVRRYGAVIRDGANPVSRLNIITNTERAADFLGTRARSILGSDIDIEVTVQP